MSCFQDCRDFGSSLCNLRFVLLAEEAGQGNGRQNANDHDHDHQLHQGEALAQAFAVGLALEQLKAESAFQGCHGWKGKH